MSTRLLLFGIFKSMLILTLPSQIQCIALETYFGLGLQSNKKYIPSKCFSVLISCLLFWPAIQNLINQYSFSEETAPGPVKKCSVNKLKIGQKHAALLTNHFEIPKHLETTGVIHSRNFCTIFSHSKNTSLAQWRQLATGLHSLLNWISYIWSFMLRCGFSVSWIHFFPPVRLRAKNVSTRTFFPSLCPRWSCVKGVAYT